MNYYAKGGQAHGLKALAQELPKYGRYGDDVVAHIGSEEAAMLKAMGGSGTINPVTGLPEYWGGKLNPFKKDSYFAPVVQPIANIATQALQPIEKAIVQPVGQGLASLDKFVGNTIPGGWGTVGTVAASMIPGGQFAAMGLSKAAAMGGLGALTGSGVLRPGRGFNLQGALMGGALAYGAANLASGLEGAAEGAGKTGAAAVEQAAKSGTQSALTGTGAGYIPSEFLSGTSIGAGAGQAAGALTPTANALAGAGDFVAPAFTGGTSAGASGLSAAAAPAQFGLQAVAPVAGMSNIGFGNVAVQPGFLESAGNYISNIPSNIASKATNAYEALTTPSNYESFAKDYAANVGKIGTGIKNLATGAPGASAGFTAAGSSMSNTLVPMATGAMGLQAIEAQRDYLQQQNAAGAISDADYQSQLAEINRQADVARQAVAASPFSTAPERGVSIGDTLYERPSASSTLYTKNPAASSATLYAVGGSVDDEYGMDEARGLASGNMQNGFMGGGIASYATGGQARFLSGGGDGMSDDIPATIEGKQEARLADGEFVVPADVVSHLGNGSSKAGAKQLYSMMDKVRTARTGNKKQGKQINPSKFLAA